MVYHTPISGGFEAVSEAKVLLLKPTLGFLLLLSVLISAVGSPEARAADYCVGSVAQHSDCVGGSYSATPTELQNALDDAATTGDSDRVLVGPHTITGDFVYNNPSPIEIVGAGQGKTVLTPPDQDGAEAFRLGPNSSTSSKIRDLSCQVQATKSTNCLVLYEGSIKNASVTGSTANTGSGLILNHAKASHLNVDISGDSINTQAVKIGYMGGSSTVTDSSIVARNKAAAIDASLSTQSMSFARLKISSEDTGIYINANGVGSINATLKDSLVEIKGKSSDGISFQNPSGADSANLEITGTTFVDANSWAGDGVYADAESTESTNISVRDSIIDGFNNAFRCPQGTSSTVVVESTAYQDSILDSCDGINTSSPTNKPNIDPGFVDPDQGDYHLAWNSQLIDAGSPAGGFCIVNCPHDLDGLSRFKDGSGDGTTKIDLGAFEYQRTAPTAAANASPVSVRLGESVMYTGSGNDQDPGDKLSYVWSFDDGTEETTRNVSHQFQTPGTHTATFTVTDPTGLVDKKSVSVTVLSPDGPGEPKSTSTQPPNGSNNGQNPTTGTRSDLAPRSKIAKLAKATRARKLKRLRGTATDDLKVRTVNLALVGKEGRRCFALKANGRLQRYKPVKKRCQPKFLIRAKGTKSWSFKFGKSARRALLKLAKGKRSIEVYSRATDSKGQREASFTAKRGNRRTLKLR